MMGMCRFENEPLGYKLFDVLVKMFNLMDFRLLSALCV